MQNSPAAAPQGCFLFSFPAAPHPFAQQRQRLFKLHAVPPGLRVPRRGVDTGKYKFHRQRSRLLQRHAPHEPAGDNGGENIPRAVEGGRVPRAKTGEIRPRAAVIAHSAQLIRRKGHPGEDHLLRPQRGHSPQQFTGKALVHLLPVRRTGQQAGLRDIGQRHVRPSRQAGHRRRESAVKPAVQLPVVRHGRVHDQQRIRALHRVEKVHHLLHLGRGGDVTGIERVKMHLLGPPVIGDGRQLVAEIPADKARKRRVRTEHRRGHDGALHPHGGDHRQRHRQ